MHGESRIEYSVSHIFHDFSVRDITRINCMPVLFTGTGTAEFAGFRVHVLGWQHRYTLFCTDTYYNSKKYTSTKFSILEYSTWFRGDTVEQVSTNESGGRGKPDT